MLREGKQKTDLRYRKIGEPNSHNKIVLLLPTSLAYNWQEANKSEKKKIHYLLTTRGVKCALADTIADVDHGCGVIIITREQLRRAAVESPLQTVLVFITLVGSWVD